jgi:hypothetical protein
MRAPPHKHTETIMIKALKCHNWTNVHVHILLNIISNILKFGHRAFNCPVYIAFSVAIHSEVKML